MDEQMKLFEMLERMINAIGSKVDKTNETVVEIKVEQAKQSEHLNNISDRLDKLESNADKTFSSNVWRVVQKNSKLALLLAFALLIGAVFGFDKLALLLPFLQ